MQKYNKIQIHDIKWMKFCGLLFKSKGVDPTQIIKGIKYEKVLCVILKYNPEGHIVCV